MDRATSNPRRTYSKPHLVRHQQLPQVAAVLAKTISGFKLPPDEQECWVARAVYGPGDGRWLLFRDWLRVDAPAWLRRSYLRHGEAFARLVGRSELLRRLLRPLMDRAIRARFGGPVA